MEQLELTQLLESNPAEFVRRIAEIKTENIHFKYETASRAGVAVSDPMRCHNRWSHVWFLFSSSGV